MSYVALYRKFRPQTFKQVKGQDHVVRTLKNQIVNNRIGHAYLFTGTRGTGKTSVAKLFAKAVNCLNPDNGEPCNQCENCLAAMNESFIDTVEVDAASNTGVDDIRRIIDEVQYTPVNGNYKVYIIDEVHMLSTSAFNAFLKTLEEPPSYVIFILATTEPHKLPITILSRCQRYDFRRISNETITENLRELTEKENVEADDKALRFIARAGDGSMRDSISLLDKCIAFNLGNRLTYENVLDTLGSADTDIYSELFRSVYAGDTKSVLEKIEDASAAGKDLTQYISDFIWYLRNLLFVNADPKIEADALGVSAENMETIRKDSSADALVLMRYIRILSELVNDIRFSRNRQILIEVAFIKMTRPQMETDGESLADRVRQLESGAVSFKAAAPEAQPAVMPAQPQAPKKIESVQKPQAEPVAQRQPQPAPAKGGAANEVINLWNDIVMSCESRLVRSALRKSSPEQVDESTVAVVAGNDTAGLELKDRAEEITELVKRITGADVRILIKTSKGIIGSAAQTQPAAVKQENAAPAMGGNDMFPDELLKNINFNIGTED